MGAWYSHPMPTPTTQTIIDTLTGGGASRAQQAIEDAQAAAQQARALLVLTAVLGTATVGLLLYLALREGS